LQYVSECNITMMGSQLTSSRLLILCHPIGRSANKTIDHSDDGKQGFYIIKSLMAFLVVLIHAFLSLLC